MEFKKEDSMPDYSGLIDLINAEWPEEFGLLTDEEKIKEMARSHNEKQIL
jgi:hypothetical protein